MLGNDKNKTRKWLKIVPIAALLAGSGYFFGTVSARIGRAYALVLAPSMELLTLLGWYLLAVVLFMTSAGLVAALFRPLWVGISAFALAGLTMLLGWQLTLGSALLALVLLLVALIYLVDIAKELDQRINFSVRPISEGQGKLLTVLTFVACGSFFFGCTAHIKREGFSIPEAFINPIRVQMEQQVTSQVPEEKREEAAEQFRLEFQGMVDSFINRTVKPYTRFIPLAIAAILYMSLLTITHFIDWVPTLLLRLIFPLLAALGATRVVSEKQEVHKLVL